MNGTDLRPFSTCSGEKTRPQHPKRVVLKLQYAPQSSGELVKYRFLGEALWLMPVIPALWESKVGGSQGQEIKIILSLLKYKKISLACWHVPVVPATEEAEAGELLEPGQQRLQ